MRLHHFSSICVFYIVVLNFPVGSPNFNIYFEPRPYQLGEAKKIMGTTIGLTKSVLVTDPAICWKSFVYAHLTYKLKMLSRSMNSMAWKPAKLAKFVPVLTNTWDLEKLKTLCGQILKVRQTYREASWRT